MTVRRDEFAYNKIKSLLQNGQIKPGDKFSAYQLSEKLGISRTPITAALKKLEQEGIVDIIPQVGSIFKYPNREEARENFLLRAVLEGFAAEMATMNASKSEIDEIEEIYQAGINDSKLCLPEKYAEANKRFHMKIIELSKMPHLIELTNNFYENTIYLSISGDFVFSRCNISVQEHGEIVKMMKNREAGMARRLVESHLRKCTDDFVNMITEHER